MLDAKQKSDIDDLFASIAQDLSTEGYSVCLGAIPSSLVQALTEDARRFHSGFSQAGVGRQSLHVVDETVRGDKIRWISGNTEAGRDWLTWIDGVKQYLNRRLFLGLNYFESHFAHYEEGAFYKKHKDAFVGQGNRILSVVTYLNEDWLQRDGGQLVIFGEDDKELERVSPQSGTLVLFLSEEFPHEVLPAQRERYSIAGWFRANGN